MMKKLIDSFSWLLEWVLTGLVATFTLITIAQVVFRYLFHDPLIWSEEASRYLFIWSVMLAAALGIKRGAHIGFDLLLEHLSGNFKKVILLVNNLLIGFFSVYLLIYGIGLVQFSGAQQAMTFKLLLSYVYLAVPVSAFAMLMFTLENFCTLFSGSQAVEKEKTSC